MLFGLTNALATFTRALDVVLSGMKWKACLVTFDDSIHFSDLFEVHLCHDTEILRNLDNAHESLRLLSERFSTLSLHILDIL